MPNHLGDSVIKRYYLGLIQDDLEEIKELNLENKDFQVLRERLANDWEVVEACREILFLNARCIKRLKERIDENKSFAKKFDGLSG